jgi:adenylylsulfate kinase
MSDAANLHPIFDRVLPRAEKEARLGQRGQVIWLYGLSGSGKSTLAIALERRLCTRKALPPSFWMGTTSAPA